MLEMKIYNLCEVLLKHVARWAVARLQRREDEIHRKIESTNEAAQKEIQFAHAVFHRAEEKQQIKIVQYGFQKADIEGAYQSIIQRAGV